MTLREPTRKFEFGPLHLLLLLALLQLAVTLLTDGFSLSFDESMWHYIGRNWFHHGLTPYTGGVDNKSPLIFALFGLSDKLFGVNYWFPRVVGTCCQCAGIFYVYKIAKHIAGKQAGMLAMLLYGLSLLWRITNGKFVSVTQTYEITCIIIAYYRMLAAVRGRDYFISGVFAGLGLAFRISAIFGLGALFISTCRKGKTAALQLIAGVLLSVAILAVLSMISGINLREFVFYGFTDNFGPGSPTDYSFLWKLDHFSEKFFYSELVLFYPAVIAYILLVKKTDWLILWMIFEFAGINIVGMYDRSHLKDILPSFSLSAALALAWLINKYNLSVKQITLVIWICFFPKLIEPLVSFKKLFTGVHDNPDKLCQAPYPATDDYFKKQLGLWIKANTPEQEKVLVAGIGAEIQVYSERISPGIYFNATRTNFAKARFVSEIKAEKPGMIAIPLSFEYQRDTGLEIREFLSALIRDEYYFDSCKYGYSIYRIKTR